jgi:hypothetical protein
MLNLPNSGSETVRTKDGDTEDTEAANKPEVNSLIPRLFTQTKSNAKHSAAVRPVE